MFSSPHLSLTLRRSATCVNVRPSSILFWMSLLVISSVTSSGCDPRTFYNTKEMSIDLNGCINRSECEESLFSRTTLGCYITEDTNDMSIIRRNRFQVGNTGELIFDDDLLPVEVGDSFNGGLYFFSDRQSCGDLIPSSPCDEGCLLRLGHSEITVGNRTTVVQFTTEDTCMIETADPEILSACSEPMSEEDMTPDLDIELADMDMNSDRDVGAEDMDMDEGCDLNLVGTECDVQGIGECAKGIYRCQDDMIQCEAKVETIESCDNLDNDCDGSIDEDLGGDLCTVGVGACQTGGVFACIGGQFSCATPEVPLPAIDDATCDQIDDDCDGLNDENYPNQVTSCGQGICAATGVLTCERGQEVNSCLEGSAGPSDGDICDGLDSDCDGIVDESFSPENTMCGTGICASTGQRTCENGMIMDSCAPIPVDPTESDQSCNLSDDDCDGAIDEGYMITVAGCGLGVCSAAGQLICQNGAVTNTCIEGQVTDANDVTCDGLDGDCDGRVDEGAGDQVSTCGIGVCQRFGVLSCVNGAPVDSCAEGEPTRRDDPTCNALDEDCDGQIDEDFISYASPPCGDGVCQNIGEITCENGSLNDDCQALPAPSIDDQTCNNIDEDCDGEIDEDFPEVPTSCGVGECASQGVNRCDNGSNIDTCEPITFTGAIEDICDGLDNDCDNTVDEDYSVQPVNCDVAISCVKTGYTTCINQQLSDTCDDPSSRDSDSDGTGDPCAWVLQAETSLPFDILRHEVTFGAYQDCIASGGCGVNPINYRVVDQIDDRTGCEYIPVGDPTDEPEGFPLRCTNNRQLEEYCDWIGGRVPTLDEMTTNIQPILGPFDCSNSNGGDCPDATGLPLPVCSLEQAPGDLLVCDIGGNVYEASSTYSGEGDSRVSVCFDDFTGGNTIFNSCALQRVSRMGPRIGGRCIRD